MFCTLIASEIYILKHSNTSLSFLTGFSYILIADINLVIMNKDPDKPDERSRFSFSSVLSDNSDFSNIEDEDDPVCAYFRQRTMRSNKKQPPKPESDSESSLEILDLDNISLLDDKSRGDINKELYDDTLSIIIEAPVENETKKKDDVVFKRPFPVKPKEGNEAELNLMKQRVLAKKAILQAKEKNIEESKSPKQRISNVSRNSDIFKKNWFDYNQSPETPRYFKDELSSIYADSVTINDDKGAAKELDFDNDMLKTDFEKEINNLKSPMGNLSFGSDLFEEQNSDDILKKLEEDEKKFKKDQSALSHDSRISHFSNMAEEERFSLSSKHQRDDEPEKLSAEQNSGRKSGRISSLVGSVAEKDFSFGFTGFDSGLPSSTLSEKSWAENKSKQSSARKPSSFFPDKTKSKSTLTLQDWEKERSSLRRESTESNNTVSIQDLIAGLESGLSGTEIYEQLMNHPKAEKKKPPNKNVDTPKSSKTSKRRKSKSKSPSSSLRTPTNECLRHSPKATPKSTRRKSPESKENSVGRKERKSRIDQNVLIEKNERVKKLKEKKGFDSSTPKAENFKGKKEAFTAIANKKLMEGDEWEPPRVSSIQPNGNLNRTGQSGENDHTITLNCSSISSDTNRKNDTIVGTQIVTVEDSINCGDLTILSQRIDDMKGQSFTEIKRKEATVLSVVQKLSNFPIGTLDCAALTPIIRKEYPELLAAEPHFDNDESLLPDANKSLKETLTLEPGSWIKLSTQRGLSEKINICAEVEKSVSVPLVNVSKTWLLISIQSVCLLSQHAKPLHGVNKNNVWSVDEFLSVSLRDTVVPPMNQQSLKFVVTPRIPITFNVQIVLLTQELLGQRTQERKINLYVTGINPVNNLNISPEGPINFGLVPEECIDEKTITLNFDGVCDLPLQAFVKEVGSHSQWLVLSQNVILNGSLLVEDVWKDGKFVYTLREGEKQILEFKVVLISKSLSEIKHIGQLDIKGLFITKLDIKRDIDSTLWAVPISGSVGFSKFLCNPACSPLVFKTTAMGKCSTRSFPMKNVGAVPLTFQVRVICEKTKKEQTDDLFITPKTMHLPKNEEASLSIIFTGNTKENYVKRLLTLQLIPNGRVFYDVELVGIVIPTVEVKPPSRQSNPSEITSSIASSDLVPIKILATYQSVSWAALTLEKEMRQTFYIKNVSDVRATARISFQKDTNAFRIVNEDNEKMQKIRKILKPDTPLQIRIAFRPDTVGPHHNALLIETNSLSPKTMISLNGYGGNPDIFIRNTKSDLNGHKMIKLHNVSPEQQIFSNSLEFFNKGSVPGFVSIRPLMKVLSLSNELNITPSNFVIEPNGKTTVHLSQRLKNQDIKILLSGKDISNLANLSVIMGDEPSRLRLRKVVERKGLEPNEFVQSLIRKYINEGEMDLKRFHDNQYFEKIFLNSLKTVDIAVVVERLSAYGEATFLEDNDETIKEFLTICGAVDSSTISPLRPQATYLKSSRSPEKPKMNASGSSSSSSSSQRHAKKVTKWLESVENVFES